MNLRFLAVLTPSHMRALKDISGFTGSGGNVINQSIAIAATDAASSMASRRQVQIDLADAKQAAVNGTR